MIRVNIRSSILLIPAYPLKFTEKLLSFPLSMYSYPTPGTLKQERHIVELFLKLNDPCGEQHPIGRQSKASKS